MKYLYVCFLMRTMKTKSPVPRKTCPWCKSQALSCLSLLGRGLSLVHDPQTWGFVAVPHACASFIVFVLE